MHHFVLCSGTLPKINNTKNLAFVEKYPYNTKSSAKLLPILVIPEVAHWQTINISAVSATESTDARYAP